jgi:hypothetical protein
MQHSNNTTPSKTIPVRDRDFEEVEGGYYDPNGWYITPNGSFWDENGTYFNREGMDINGGTFDEYGIYIPGPGWNEDLYCYEDREILQMPEEVQKKIYEKLNEELIDEYEYYQNLFSNPDNTQLNDFEINNNQNQLPLRESYSYENDGRNNFTPSKVNY